MLPEGASPFKNTNGAKEPLSFHLQSYGFFSSLFIVLHFVVMILALLAVVTWIVLRIVLKKQMGGTKGEEQVQCIDRWFSRVFYRLLCVFYVPFTVSTLIDINKDTNT